jgi:molybdopterin-binding protein
MPIASHTGQDIRVPPMSIRTAAEKLGVGYSTLKRWVHTGRVRTVRTEGGHHRVTQAELDRLATHQQPAGRPLPRLSENDEALAGLSARNRLHGFVEEVRIDGLLAQVRLRVGDQHLTAVITADAVTSLGLRRGDDAIAVVKSTEVMIGRAGRSPVNDRSAGRRRRHAR